MKMPEYKRRQIEFENRMRPRYNLEPVRWTPVERFYAEREYSYGLELLRDILQVV